MEQHEHHSPEHDHHEHHMAEQGATGQDVAAVEVHEDHEAHAAHHPHIFKKQFFISLGLTIPTLVFSPMIGQWLGYGNLFPGSNYVSAAFGTAMLFTVGRIFLTSGWAEIKRRKPGMMALIALALVVAFGYSLFLLVANAFGLNIMAGMDFWWELAALITIMLGGHWVEMNSVQRAQNSVGELVKLIPDVVEIIEDGFPVKTLSLIHI